MGDHNSLDLCDILVTISRVVRGLRIPFRVPMPTPPRAQLHTADPSSSQGRIYPPPAAPDPRDAISLDEWGYADTAFAVDANDAITVTGNRYPGLSGETLPDLLPWFRKVIGVDFSVRDADEGSYPPDVPESHPAPEFLAEIRGVMTAVASLRGLPL